MLGFVEYEAGVCTGCGLHSSVAETDPYFTLDDRASPVCAQIEPELRSRASREHDAEKEAAAATKRPSDGRSTYVRLLSPAEIARSLYT